MRYMPRQPRGGPVPVISPTAWMARLAEIAGRDLTAEETTRAYKMAAHNWTVRTTAAELFGHALVDAFYLPAESKK